MRRLPSLAGDHGADVGLGLAELAEDAAGVLEQGPAHGVRMRGRGPPGRSKTGAPIARSRPAICWLTADCV